MPLQPQPRYGRHHAPDERDQKYLLGQVTTPPVTRKTKRWLRTTPIGDQGNYGVCVDWGWRYQLETRPITQVKRFDPIPEFAIYDLAITLDEWSDNDHDTGRQMGTSVRGGAKALQQMGYIGAYGWATSPEGVADWVGGVDAQGHFTGGSIVLGITMYYSMEDVDREGFMRISPTSAVAGGHCLCCDGVNIERGFFEGPNSWGTDNFGRLWRGRRNGRWKLDGETLGRLLNEQGEACAALELRRAKAA